MKLLLFFLLFSIQLFAQKGKKLIFTDEFYHNYLNENQILDSLLNYYAKCDYKLLNKKQKNIHTIGNLRNNLIYFSTAEFLNISKANQKEINKVLILLKENEIQVQFSEFLTFYTNLKKEQNENSFEKIYAKLDEKAQSKLDVYLIVLNEYLYNIDYNLKLKEFVSNNQKNLVQIKTNFDCTHGEKWKCKLDTSYNIKTYFHFKKNKCIYESFNTNGDKIQYVRKYDNFELKKEWDELHVLKSISKKRRSKHTILKYSVDGKCLSREKIIGSENFSCVAEINGSFEKCYYNQKEVKFVNGKYEYLSGEKVRVKFKHTIKYY